MTRLHARFAAGVLRRPRLVLALSAIAAAAAAWLLATRLRIDPDIERLFPRDDPTLRLTRHLQGDSPPSRVLFIVLRADDPAKLEETLPGIVERLRASPCLARVVATRREFAGPRWEWFEQAPLAALPEESFEPLRDRLAGPGRRKELESTIRRMEDDPLAGKQTALADPLGLRWIFEEAASRPGRFPFALRHGSPYLVVDRPPLACVRAIGTDDSFNTSFSEKLLRDVRARLPAGAELAGGYVSAEHHAGAMRKDMQVQIASSMVLVLLFLCWFTRSWVAPHFLLAPLGLALALGLGLGGWILGPLTPIAVSSAAILIAQGIDFPVHFLSRFRAERARAGRDEAIASSQVSLGPPFLGAAATTMAAFLALLASRFPGFRQLGTMLSIGFALALAASVTLLPVLLRAADRFARPEGDRTPWLVRAAGAIADRPAGRLAAAVLALAGLGAWGVVAARGVPMDLDLRNSMPPGDPGLEVLRGLERDLETSLTPVFALVDARTPLEWIRARVAALRAGGAIGAADGPQDLFPPGEARERLRRETNEWVKGALAEMKSLGLAPERFRAGLEGWRRRLEADPAPEALERPEHEALRRMFLFEDGGRRSWVVWLFPRRSLWRPGDRAAFDAQARAALGAGAELYGAFHLPDHYERVLRGDLERVALWTAAGVVALTLLSVGSLGAGLLALLPVILATGATLAAAALLGHSVNPMNMVAVPIVLGIGVDSGIHYACRLREVRDPARAALDAGPGVWGSTVTTLLGFGSIAFSVTPGLSSMGVLVAVGAGMSLLSALFLLPACAKMRASIWGGRA